MRYLIPEFLRQRHKPVVLGANDGVHPIKTRAILWVDYWGVKANRTSTNRTVHVNLRSH